MKLNKSLLVVALGLCAAGAQAQTGWTITGPATVTASVPPALLNQTSVYTFLPNQSGTLIPAGNILAYSPIIGGNPLAAYAVISEPATFTAGTSFTVTVQWSTVSSVAGTDFGFENFLLDTSFGYQATSQTFDITPAAVPEPAQTVAGGMLFGIGGLVFVGRRLLKKQAA